MTDKETRDIIIELNRTQFQELLQVFFTLRIQIAYVLHLV